MSFGLLKMAWRNLARNKRRNFATASAVALGVTGLTALSSYLYQEENVRRVFTVYTSRVGHLIVYKEHGFSNLEGDPEQYSWTPEEVDKIRTVLSDAPGVEFHGPQLVGSGLISNSCTTLPFNALGIEPATEQKLRQHPEVKRWGTLAETSYQGQGLWDMPQDFAGVLLGSNLAQLLRKHKVYSEVAKDHVFDVIDCKAPDAPAKWDVDANVQLSANGWNGSPGAIDGDIIGRLNTGSTQTDANFVLAPISYLQKLYGTSHVSRYTVWLKDGTDLDAAATYLSDRFVQTGLRAEIKSFQDEAVAPYYSGTMNFIRIVIIFVMLVMALVIGLSVFNSATITAMERSKEIGMMRSLGYTRRRIRVIFAVESGVLTGISVLIGFAGGILTNTILNTSEIGYRTPGMDIAAEYLSMTLHPTSVAALGAIVFLVSIATTLVAVWSIAKLGVADLLAGHSR